MVTELSNAFWNIEDAADMLVGLHKQAENLHNSQSYRAALHEIIDVWEAELPREYNFLGSLNTVVGLAPKDVSKLARTAIQTHNAIFNRVDRIDMADTIEVQDAVVDAIAYIKKLAREAADVIDLGYDYDLIED